MVTTDSEPVRPPVPGDMVMLASGDTCTLPTWREPDLMVYLSMARARLSLPGWPGMAGGRVKLLDPLTTTYSPTVEFWRSILVMVVMVVEEAWV